MERVDRLESDVVSCKGLSEKVVHATNVKVTPARHSDNQKMLWVVVGLTVSEAAFGGSVKVGRCLAAERLVRADVVELLTPAIEKALLSVTIFRRLRLDVC